MIWNNSIALTTFRVDFTGEKSRDKNMLMSQNERHNMKEGVCRLLLDTASQGSKWTMILSWGRGGGVRHSLGVFVVNFLPSFFLTCMNVC